MPVTRKQKEASVEQLTEQFKKAKTIVFSQYQGTNVKNMRSLRKKLFDSKVELEVARKTLMRIAAKNAGFQEIPDEMMQGPIALAISSGDQIAPAKILFEAGKDTETIKIVGALFEGKYISALEAQAIASLPSREVLLGKLVGVMKSPISGFHGVLYSLLRGFVYTLSEIQKKMPQQAQVAEAPVVGAEPQPA